MLRASLVILGGRARGRVVRTTGTKVVKAGKKVSLAVPVTVDRRRETAAQREFERLISLARRQKKRQIQSAIREALKRQSRQDMEMTARQQRYVANTALAGKELERIAGERERRQRRIEEQAAVTRMAAGRDTRALRSRTSSHSKQPSKRSVLTENRQVRREREERASAEFIKMMAALQHRRREQIERAVKAALKLQATRRSPASAAEGKAKRKELATMEPQPQVAERAVRKDRIRADEVTAVGERARVSDSTKPARRASKPKARTAEEEAAAEAATDAEVERVLLSMRGNDVPHTPEAGTAAPTPASPAAKGRHSRKTSIASTTVDEGDDVAEAIMHHVEPPSPAAAEEVAIVGEAEASDALEKDVVASQEQPLAEPTTSDIELVYGRRHGRSARPSENTDEARAAYFDVVRRRVSNRLLLRETGEQQGQHLLSSALASTGTSTWPTPETTTGLFRL